MPPKIPPRYCFRCNKLFTKKSSFDYYIKNVANKEKCVLNNGQDDAIDVINTNTDINTNNKKYIKQTIINTTNIHFVIANYPDALNIEDCININKITPDVKTNCENLQLTDGLIYLMKTFCDIDHRYRPLHCIDYNRDNYIIKTNNTWTVDPKASEIRKYFEPIAYKTYDEICRIKKQSNKGDLMAITNIINSYDTNLIRKNFKKCCKNALRENNGYFMLKNSITQKQLE